MATKALSLNQNIYQRYFSFISRNYKKLNSSSFEHTIKMWIRSRRPQPQYEQDGYFRDDLVYLLTHSSHHCYNHLAAWNTRSRLEFLMWLTIHITDITVLIFITLTAWENFNTSPILTSLYDTLYPISEIEFPAVILCNINRISRRAALKIATELDERDPDPEKNLTYFMKNMLYLGKLYDYDIEQDDRYSTQHFEELLENYFVDNSTDIFSMRDLLYRLAPKCEDTLIRCFWKSVEINCLDRINMMEVKITPLGPCCTFNYLKTAKPDEKEREPHFTNLTGPDMGLILVVNGSSNDYYYPIANSIGFNLQILQPIDIPDGPSGSMVEGKINLGYETFVRVNGIPIVTTSEVQGYAPETRQCLFHDELSIKFHNGYERGECIVRCRKRSIAVLCGCVPFFYATTGADEKLGICSLQHIACLSKYKIKWYTLVTHLEDIEGLEKEMEESLYCPDCLPSCSEVTYQVSSSELPLVASKRTGFSLINNNIYNVSDISIIRVFFGQSETWLYKQDVAMYWFEILSSYGGMFGVLCGFSLISYFEFIYFILKHAVIFIYRNIDIGFAHKKQLRIYP